MVYFLHSLVVRQCALIPFATFGALVASGIVLTPTAAIANEFLTCGRVLTEAGLDAEAVAAACAQALHPQVMARCVTDITDSTDMMADQALTACQRDRRPQELATCVTALHTNLEMADSTQVLDNCSRSILPLRYSDCVLGLVETTDLSPAASLAACGVAGDRPMELAPTFIFAN